MVYSLNTITSSILHDDLPKFQVCKRWNSNHAICIFLCVISFGWSQFCPNEAFGTFYYLRTHCTFHYFICCEMIAACKLHVDYLKRFSNALVVKHKIHTYIMNQIIFLFYMRKNIIRKFNSLTKCKTLASLESLDPKARALPLGYSTFNSR